MPANGSASVVPAAPGAAEISATPRSAPAGRAAAAGDAGDSGPARRWLPVLPEAALPEGKAVRAWADGLRLVVGRLSGGDGCFAALDSCPHLDLPLAAFGAVQVERNRLICPWHRWEFDARTGRCEYASLYANDEM
ncbi:MAG: Rieske (2Fe-2S) protein, partial [Chloroflexota bacterium]